MVWSIGLVNAVKNTAQIIYRQGEPEYAVVPWAEYQKLLQAAGYSLEQSTQAESAEAPAAKQVSQLADLGDIRQQAGLSVEQLAQEVGISPHYLRLIEQGEREASNVILRALARVLKVEQWNQ